MRYRRLADTDLELSEISFGTGDNAGAIVYGSPAEQRAAVGAALELGVNCFDTSPDYGKGLAEANLGRVLGELDGGDRALVITKVEIMPEHLEMIPLRISESIDGSLTRLGREAIDVLMLHNPCRSQRNEAVRFPWTPVTPDDVVGQALAGFEAARAAGKVRHLGLASERAEPAAVIVALDSGAFSLIHVWFNLANPTAARDTRLPGIRPEEDYTGLLAAAHARGVGVAAIRPLAGGALVADVLDRGPAARHPLSGGYYSWHPELLMPEIERGRRFRFLHRDGEQTLSEAAYRFILAHPQINTVIGGFSEPAHIEEAARASDRGPLDPADGGAIEAVLAAGFRAEATHAFAIYEEAL
jgi:aryl-alcohol dehydrogenase-like predicted oxidoreductase